MRGTKGKHGLQERLCWAGTDTEGFLEEVMHAGGGSESGLEHECRLASWAEVGTTGDLECGIGHTPLIFLLSVDAHGDCKVMPPGPLGGVPSLRLGEHP